MNKADLVEKIAQSTQVSRKDVAKVIDAFLAEVGGALGSGQSVTIVGFGTFRMQERPAREGRNPRTGETIRIPACRVPRFVPGKALRELGR